MPEPECRRMWCGFSECKILTKSNAYDLIASMSWSIHYCAGEQELIDVIRQFQRALARQGGGCYCRSRTPRICGATGWRIVRRGQTGDPQDVSLRFQISTR